MGNNNAIQDPSARRMGTTATIESLKGQIKAQPGPHLGPKGLESLQQASELYKQLISTIDTEMKDIEKEYAGATPERQAAINQRRDDLQDELDDATGRSGVVDRNLTLAQTPPYQETLKARQQDKRTREQLSAFRQEAFTQKRNATVNALKREFIEAFPTSAEYMEGPGYPVYLRDFQKIATDIALGKNVTFDASGPDSEFKRRVQVFVERINDGKHPVFPRQSESVFAEDDEFEWGTQPTTATTPARDEQPVVPLDAEKDAVDVRDSWRPSEASVPSFTAAVDIATAFERAAEIYFQNRYYDYEKGKRVTPEMKTRWIELAKAEMESQDILGIDQWAVLEQQFNLNTPEPPYSVANALTFDRGIGDAIRDQMPDAFDTSERTRRFDNNNIAPSFGYIYQELSRSLGLGDNLGDDADNKKKWLIEKVDEILLSLPAQTEVGAGVEYEGLYQQVHSVINNFENEKDWEQQFAEQRTKTVGFTLSGITKQLRNSLTFEELGEEGIEIDWTIQRNKTWLNKKAQEIYDKYNTANAADETGVSKNYTPGNNLLPSLIEEQRNKGADGIIDEINETRTDESIIKEWLERQDLTAANEKIAIGGWKNCYDAWIDSESKESLLVWMEREDHSELLGTTISQERNPTDVDARWTKFIDLALSSGKLPADYKKWQLDNAKKLFAELENDFAVAWRGDRSTQYRGMLNDAVAGWDVEEDARRRESQFGGRAPDMGLEGGPTLEAREVAEGRVIERRGGWESGAKEQLKKDLESASSALKAQEDAMRDMDKSTSEWEEQEKHRLSLAEKVTELNTRQTNRENDDRLQELFSKYPVLAQAFASGDADSLETLLDEIGAMPEHKDDVDFDEFIVSTKQAQERQGLVLSDEEIALRTAMGIPPVQTGFPTIAELQQEQDVRDRSSLRSRFRTTKYTAEGNEMEFHTVLTPDNYADVVGKLKEGDTIPGTNLRNTAENRGIIQDEFSAGGVLKDYNVYDPEAMTRTKPFEEIPKGTKIPNTDILDTPENRLKYRDQQRYQAFQRDEDWAKDYGQTPKYDEPPPTP